MANVIDSMLSKSIKPEKQFSLPTGESVEIPGVTLDVGKIETEEVAAAKARGTKRLASDLPIKAVRIGNALIAQDELEASALAFNRFSSNFVKLTNIKNEQEISIAERTIKKWLQAKQVEMMKKSHELDLRLAGMKISEEKKAKIREAWGNFAQGVGKMSWLGFYALGRNSKAPGLPDLKGQELEASSFDFEGIA